MKYKLSFLIMLIFILTGCSNMGTINSHVNTADTNVTEKTKVSSDALATDIISDEKPADEKQNYSSNLKVHFLDVGQADCILIELPNGQKMIVDAGNNDDKDTIISYIDSLGIKKFDYLVGTHPHEDHIGALDSVINSYEIGRVYMPNAPSNTKTFEDVLLAVKNKGLKITAPKPGCYILDDNKGISVQVLAPNSSSYEDLNNYSIVLKIKYKNTSLLLACDAEEILENEILAKGYDVKADVLKIGHHGSSSSTSLQFLKKVSPKYAVISVGQDNKYGHPHAETLEKLNSTGVQILRTDTEGSIVIISDGSKISIDKKSSPVKENAPPDTELEKQEPIKQKSSVYIGNKNTKVFHRDTCSSLPASKNRVEFTTSDDAVNAGYKACQNCRP